jgi:hypothetical protein
MAIITQEVFWFIIQTYFFNRSGTNNRKDKQGVTQKYKHNKSNFKFSFNRFETELQNITVI